MHHTELLILFFLLWNIFPALAKSSGPSPGLITGHHHLVFLKADRVAGQGIEAGIPPNSAYAKGIALDMAGKWEDSYAVYERAQGEFRALLREKSPWTKIIRGWIIKAECQQDQSQRLRYRSYNVWGSPSASMLYYRAAAKHTKWLAIRGATGKNQNTLLKEIIDDYQHALQISNTYDSVRIALSTLYHELGDHKKALQEFAKVKDLQRGWMNVELAYYYAAAGEREKSLTLLEKAIQYNSSHKRLLLCSNGFDSLRGDPRFKKLVEDP